MRLKKINVCLAKHVDKNIHFSFYDKRIWILMEIKMQSKRNIQCLLFYEIIMKPFYFSYSV